MESWEGIVRAMGSLGFSPGEALILAALTIEMNLIRKRVADVETRVLNHGIVCGVRKHG